MRIPAFARGLCLNLGILILTIAAWAGVHAPNPIFLLAVVPLLLPLPGLWRGSRYTATWASLLVIPYLLAAVVEIIANPAGRLTASCVVAASFTLFVGLLVMARGNVKPTGRRGSS
ncbi:hypothetical protein BH24PSE2_BH24PSE2_15100 [soil metagenome]